MILGAMIRAHVRDTLLDIALSELFRYEKLGLIVKVHLLADRPNWLVEKVIEKWRDRLYGMRYSPFPLVSPAGERFMEASNLQIESLERCSPDWVAFCDDDRWLQPSGADRELLPALSRTDIDLLYAHSLFVWNRPDQYNAARHHHSPIFWRHHRGDRFPRSRERIIQAPLPLHDDAITHSRYDTLKTPLLDYGTLTESERVRVHEAFDAAGKRDDYVSSLSETPDLRPLPLLPGDDLFSRHFNA